MNAYGIYKNSDEFGEIAERLNTIDIEVRFVESCSLKRCLTVEVHKFNYNKNIYFFNSLEN